MSRMAAAAATSATSLCNGIAGGEREARFSSGSLDHSVLVFASMCCADFIIHNHEYRFLPAAKPAGQWLTLA